MDLKPLNKKGLLFCDDKTIIFFGGALFNESDLKKFAPNTYKIKQTHSKIVVQAADAEPEADAQWTFEAKRPLLIKTADCLPIMISINNGEYIAAIHAGWRGVQQKIITEFFSEVKNKFEIKKIDVWIGPHIQKDSFEIDEKVFSEIKSNHAINPMDFEQKNKKYYLSLKNLVINELKQQKSPLFFKYISDVDTRSSTDYCSFRRDQNTDRNFSFILKLG